MVVVAVGGRVGGLLRPAVLVRGAEEAVPAVALPAGRRAAVVAVAPVALEVAAAGRVVPAALTVAGDLGEVVLGASLSAIAAVLRWWGGSWRVIVADWQFCRGDEEYDISNPTN